MTITKSSLIADYSKKLSEMCLPGSATSASDLTQVGSKLCIALEGIRPPLDLGERVEVIAGIRDAYCEKIGHQVALHPTRHEMKLSAFIVGYQNQALGFIENDQDFLAHRKEAEEAIALPASLSADKEASLNSEKTTGLPTRFTALFDKLGGR